MKKILITGASGFIGSFLVDEALSRGYEVYAGIRSSSNKKYLRNNRIQFLELDYSDTVKLEKTFSDFKKAHGSFDYVIHNAGITKAKHKEDYFSVNFQLTKNLVDALVKSKSIPQKFIYISSLAAYGPGAGNIPIKHDDVPFPISFYGQSKLESEKYISEVNNFPFIIIRPSIVYGPRDKELYVLYKVLNRGLEPYIRSTNQKLSCVYVRDLSHVIFKSMESAHTRRAYFISDGNEYTIRAFNQTIKNHLVKKTVKLVIPSAMARPIAFSMELFAGMFGKISTFNRERLKEYEAANWLCDISHLKEELDFIPAYNLDSGMQATIQWYKNNKWL
jgi:nucleoside-diphosphate-sugar epimerase